MPQGKDHYDLQVRLDQESSPDHCGGKNRKLLL